MRLVYTPYCGLESRRPTPRPTPPILARAHWTQGRMDQVWSNGASTAVWACSPCSQRGALSWQSPDLRLPSTAREQVTCVQRLFPGAFGTSNKLWKCSLDFRHVRKSGLEAVGLGAIFGSSLEFEHVISRSQPALHSQLVPSWSKACASLRVEQSLDACCWSLGIAFAAFQAGRALAHVLSFLPWHL
jgi:hypothetical protein